MIFQWVTTNPNPRSPATGHDAGQRGWKLHAVEAEESDTSAAIKYRKAACGMRAKYGWRLDMFIEDKCVKCVSKVS